MPTLENSTYNLPTTTNMTLVEERSNEVQLEEWLYQHEEELHETTSKNIILDKEVIEEKSLETNCQYEEETTRALPAKEEEEVTPLKIKKNDEEEPFYETTLLGNCIFDY